MFKLSVIIPVYNVRNYIEKCLESVCKNKYGNLEIIIIDDGSTDGSGDVCDEFALNDTRIKVIHVENGGLTTARKIGLMVSSGEYITFVDGDDWIENDMYVSVMDKIENHDYDILMTGMWREINGNVYAEWRPSQFEEGEYYGEKLTGLKNNVFSHGFNMISGSSVNKIFKRDIITSSILTIDNNNCGVADDDFVHLAVLMSKRIFIWNKSFYHAVERSDSASHSLHKDYYYQMQMAYETFFHMLRQVDDEACQFEIKKAYLFRLLSGIENLFSDIYFPVYIWKDCASFSGKRIFLYGGGSVGEAYFKQCSVLGTIDVVGWVDSNISKSVITKNILISPKEISAYKYDYIVIAVADENISNDIRRELISIGITDEKIIWNRPLNIIDLLIKRVQDDKEKSLIHYTV